jgi:hypothetical protein
VKALLDFGTVALGNPTEEAMLAILNEALLAEQASTDLLSTNGDGSMGPFRLTGCSVKDPPGGFSHSACDVFFRHKQSRGFPILIFLPGREQQFQRLR